MNNLYAMRYLPKDQDKIPNQLKTTADNPLPSNTIINGSPSVGDVHMAEGYSVLRFRVPEYHLRPVADPAIGRW